MKGKCSNCGWMGTLLIPMGDKAPGCGFGERKAFCDTCGCREVVAVR